MPEEALSADEGETLYERVHVEAVRAWVERRVAETSYRFLAEELAVGKSSLEKFVKKKAHPLKNWYKLRQGYLQYQKERKGSLQDPTDMAMLLLETVANVPAEERGRALLSLVRSLEEIHRSTRAPLPDWLPALQAIAAAEAARAPRQEVVYQPRKRGRRRRNPGEDADPGE